MGKFNTTDLAAVEAFLANNQYLSGADKPNTDDAEIFAHFVGQKPNQPDFTKFPNIFAWFNWLNMFSEQTRASWGGAAQAKGGK